MEISKAKELLTRQIEATSKLDGRTESSAEFQKWKRDTEIAIERIFGKSGRHLKDLRAITFSPGVYYSECQQMRAQTDAVKGWLKLAKSFNQ